MSMVHSVRNSTKGSSSASFSKSLMILSASAFEKASTMVLPPAASTMEGTFATWSFSSISERPLTLFCVSSDHFGSAYDHGR